MKHWDDAAILEASGLARSSRSKSVVYVQGDEDSPTYGVNTSTTKTVSRIGVKGRTLVDPEDLDMDWVGNIWLWDIGDNAASRDSVWAYKIKEPDIGTYADLHWTGYELGYPGGTAHNAETGINWPDGRQQILSKEASGSVFDLPRDLSKTDLNPMKRSHGPDANLSMVSGAVVQRDGRHVFVIRAGHNSEIQVYSPQWVLLGTVPMDTMVKPEGITISADGLTLTVCDDDGSPGGGYQDVPVPAQYQLATKPWIPGSSLLPLNPCA
jgi:hypothetical protein